MLEIAEEYMERHGHDVIGASLEFTLALRFGHSQPSSAPYTLENAVVAAITAFDLDMHQAIRLTAAALGQTWSEDRGGSLRLVANDDLHDFVRNHEFVKDSTETETEGGSDG